MRARHPERMVAQMSAATKALLRSSQLKIVIDEVDLLSPDRRDAINKVLKIVRGNTQQAAGWRCAGLRGGRHAAG